MDEKYDINCFFEVQKQKSEKWTNICPILKNVFDLF